MASIQSFIVIVGAGPAGLSAALAFSNSGYSNIHVYEKRSSPSSSSSGQISSSTTIEESYPVGINSRGLCALQGLIGQESLDVNKSMGGMVSSFDVFVGPYEWRVASFQSGTIVSATRSIVVRLLLQAVQSSRHTNNITLHYDHSMKDVNMKNKSMSFETLSKEFSVQADCLVVADGYASTTRHSIVQQSSDDALLVRQWPWNMSFRVLVSEKNPNIGDKLQKDVHHIFNGIYVAEVEDGRWAAVTSCKSESTEAEMLLLSSDSSTKNVQALKKHIEQKAPSIQCLFRNDEYPRYFQRPTFTGAVTWMSNLVVKEWAVFVGDAAHSAIPASGEGINSSLKDGLVLQQVLMAETTQGDSANNVVLRNSLTTFENKRLLDVQALSEFAYTLVRPTWKEILQKIIIRLFGGWISGSDILKNNPVQEIMFGPATSNNVMSYSAIMEEWDKQMKYLGGRPRIPPPP